MTGPPACLPWAAVVEQVRALAAGGIELAVSVDGDGTDLLLIPGLGASRSVYAPIVPALSERCRVIVFDPRDVGESGVSDGPYTMAQLAGDAVDVLDACAVERAAVFGASMGGMVAQHVALGWPDRVARLLLGCTSAGGAHVVRADPEATRALLGKGARTPEEAYRRACTVLYSAAFQRAHADVIEAQIRERARHPVRPRVFRAQYEAVRHHDTYDELPQLRLPALVLHGTEDAVMPPGNAEILAGRIPDARLQWFPGCGHLFFHEDPTAATAAIAEFLG